MLSDSGVGTLGPTTWADLGCGTGTFTLALAELLSPDSAIHAIDRDASALRKIPPAHKGVRITTHRSDFLEEEWPEWPFETVDGMLMANALHYVEDQAAFIRRCEPRMRMPRRFVIVEYDLDEPHRWVPYPVPLAKLTPLFTDAGYASIRALGSRPSVHRRAPLYAVLIGSISTT